MTKKDRYRLAAVYHEGDVRLGVFTIGEQEGWTFESAGELKMRTARIDENGNRIEGIRQNIVKYANTKGLYIEKNRKRIYLAWFEGVEK